MTVADLREVLARQRGTDDVVVSGHGRLLFVTHAATEEGAPVCVLYVESPPAEDVAAAEPQPTGAHS